MTDAEAAVVVESGVSEGNEVPLPVKETNLEEPEVVGEGSPTVADEEEETHGTPGLKRKLENLDHSQNEEAPAKKLEICQAELELEESGQTTDEATETSKLVIQGSEEQLQNNDSGCPTTEKHIEEPDAVVLGSSEVDGNVEEVQKGQNGGPDETGVIQDEMEAETLGNGQVSSTCNQHSSVDDTKDSISAPHLDGLPLTGEQSSLDHTTSSRKIEIPNNKVGVLIGKSGETIRYLQMNSGAKIQITRDADSDPESSTRPVELIGSLENISKAEQLIKDVIAEADAGGSPALVARGFNTPHSGGEQTEIQVPNEKVGMIIGKGGETIKNLQTKTGARIQLLPQHLSERDSSKVRTIRITGNKKQVESAKEMIKDVMNQFPMRPSPLSSSYGHQGFRAPRGPAPTTQWGPRASTHSQQSMGYDHQQRGMYPPQTTQYPQHYGGFSQQPLPRGTFGSSWEQQRPSAAPLHAGPQPGGHDYYHHGGPAPTNQPSNMFPGPLQTSTPPLNYNYGQSQAADGYGHPAPYSQPPPSQQSYGHGYNEPKYESQPSSQQIYGQQPPISSQAGVYGSQTAAPYGKPGYGGPTHEAHPSYAPPRGGQQPGEPIYQGSVPNQYPSNVSMQQPYPYGSSAPAHQATPYGQAYGPTSGPADGYSQQHSGGYSQHSGQPSSGYGQVPAYAQPVPQPGQYPQSQQTGYADQSTQMNPNYGYQGGVTDAGYAGNAPSTGYTAPQTVGAQPGYAQPATNPTGYYDQSMPAQSGYGSAPTATVAYAKSVSPQPGYGQYDSAQMYGHH